MGTWLAERLRMQPPVRAVSTLSGISGMFGSFLGSPFGFAVFAIEGGLEDGKLSWKMLLPSIVAASVGYAVFFALTGYTFGGVYTFPQYEQWKIVDLGYAVLLGLAGGMLGLLFIGIFRLLKRASGRWGHRPISMAMAAGLVLGSVGAVFPLVLFSGDSEVQTIIDNAVQLGAGMLLLLALLKVVVTAVCLALGWSGGYIFPSFFMGAALGLALHQLLPFIPEICASCA